MIKKFKSEKMLEGGNQMNKPNQFKIETPIVYVESDSGNHIIDVATVLIVVGIFFILSTKLKRWVKK